MGAGSLAGCSTPSFLTCLPFTGNSFCPIAYGKITSFNLSIFTRPFLEPFLKRSLEERKITAQQIRTMSQANNQSKDMEIMDVTLDEI
ncbi:MAG: hypothetical protein ACPG6P_11330, partial [Akkermansiaceae bacterium]